MHNEEEALALFDEAISKDDNLDYQGAVQILKHLQNAHLEDIEEWNILEFLGKCHWYLDEFEPAIQCLSRAEEIISDSSNSHDLLDSLNRLDILDHLGLSYFTVGKYEIALDCYERGAPFLHHYVDRKWTGSEISFYLGWGRTLFYLKRHEEALEKLGHAETISLAHSPGDDRQFGLNIVRLELGRVYLYSGKLERADTVLERVEPDRLGQFERSQLRAAQIRVAFELQRFLDVLKYFDKFDSPAQPNDLQGWVECMVAWSYWKLLDPSNASKHLFLAQNYAGDDPNLSESLRLLSSELLSWK
ncbi:MAG: tetratricopeptide repeat protein [Candidatus Zixiibacteriota bacterium]